MKGTRNSLFLWPRAARRLWVLWGGVPCAVLLCPHPQPTSLRPHQHKVAFTAISSSSIFRRDRTSLSIPKKTKLEVRPSHLPKPVRLLGRKWMLVRSWQRGTLTHPLTHEPWGPESGGWPSLAVDCNECPKGDVGIRYSLSREVRPADQDGGFRCVDGSGRPGPKGSNQSQGEKHFPNSASNGMCRQLPHSTPAGNCTL